MKEQVDKAGKALTKGQKRAQRRKKLKEATTANLAGKRSPTPLPADREALRKGVTIDESRNSSHQWEDGQPVAPTPQKGKGKGNANKGAGKGAKGKGKFRVWQGAKGAPKGKGKGKFTFRKGKGKGKSKKGKAE